MPRFQWINRAGCVELIKISMYCQQLNVEKAMNLALVRTDKYGLKYCKYPELISTSEKQRLRQNSLSAYKRYVRSLEKWKPAARGSWVQRAK